MDLVFSLTGERSARLERGSLVHIVAFRIHGLDLRYVVRSMQFQKILRRILGGA